MAQGAAATTPVLEGPQLIIAALMLALANFIVVLDTTIANVSVPHIAGGLAVSPSQGTYVITSYSVAEAITVPLTGWLASRFGTVRVFVASVLLFGIFSALCGMATSLGELVMFRVFQGLAGGPIMPMSQTMLLRIFPREKIGSAMGLWSMTTLVAPIMGPILGGVICDSWSWPFIFYINVPITILCALFAWRLLKAHETRTTKARIDRVGLALLIVWVASLQIMLDKGKELEWFDSPFIVAMAVTSAIGFVSFLIWEMTDQHPIVDLRVFRHRGYTMSVLTICLAFGGFFGSVVLTPLWLQSYMGYTATWAGLVNGMSGILAVFTAPFVAKMVGRKIDARRLVFLGVTWMALTILWRSFFTTDVTYLDNALPILLMGIGLPFFFVPLTGLALSSVDPEETASAAGLMNFARTLSGAFSASIIMTAWENTANARHAEIAGRIDPLGETSRALSAAGFSPEQVVAQMDAILQSQSIMLSTNHIFQISALVLMLAAAAIWLAPKPNRVADTSAAH